MSRSIFHAGRTPKITLLGLSLLLNPTEKLATQATSHLKLHRPESSRINKLTSVFHASVLLLIMNFVITLHGQSSCGSTVDPQTTLTMLWRKSLSLTGQIISNPDLPRPSGFEITGQTHENFYDNKLSNCSLSHVAASHIFCPLIDDKS